MKSDLKLDEAGPVFFAQGGFHVPDDNTAKMFGRMVGEIQHTTDGYAAFYYPSGKIIELGTHESFDDALHAFAVWRFKNHKATSGGSAKIRARIVRKKWHVCLLCGLHDLIVKVMKLDDQQFFLCSECVANVQNYSQEQLQALLHILKQRPEAPNMQGWLKVSDRGGFELWYRRIDSGVYVDQFTVVRGKQSWQLGTNGAEMVDTPIDREMREQLPKAYEWAVDQIARFCLKRQQDILNNPADDDRTTI